jgi:sporulation protein YlmC with PRC-barrel domain
MIQSRSVAVVLLAMASFTAPLAAQTSQPPAAKVDASKWMRKSEDGQWRTSQLSTLTITDESGRKIGSVLDMIVDAKGRISAVVLNVSDYLGAQNRFVAVPFDDLRFSQPGKVNAEDLAAGGDAPKLSTGQDIARPSGSPSSEVETASRAPLQAVLPLTRDQLRNAPAFEIAR